MEQTDTEDFIVRQSIRCRMPIPDAIQNAPVLHPWLTLYWLAFQDLTSSRQFGFSMGPISLLNMVEYCIIHGIEGECREDLLWFLPRMDSFYMEWKAKNNGSTSVQQTDAGNS